MLDDEFLLNFIKEKCKGLGISGYDIGKNTSISEQSAYKILDGTTKNPRRKNLLMILDYLESKVIGTNYKENNEKLNTVKEPPEKMITFSDLQQLIIDLQKDVIRLEREKGNLIKILEDNNIKF
jgi:hypothetical protein